MDINVSFNIENKMESIVRDREGNGMLGNREQLIVFFLLKLMALEYLVTVFN